MKIKRVHDIDDKELQQLRTRVGMLEELYRVLVNGLGDVESVLIRLEAYGIPPVYKKLEIR